MRIDVGVAGGDVEQAHAGITQALCQLQGLSQILDLVIVGVGAEHIFERQVVRRRLTRGSHGSLAVGNAVVGVESRGDDQRRQLLANASNDFPNKPRPVLKASAESAWPIPGGQQFREQIAVTLLEVDEVDANPGREACRGDILVGDACEVLVGGERKGVIDWPAAGLVDRERIADRIV